MKDLIAKLRHGKQYGYEILFRGQDRRIEGKPGVILAEMGMPENYEYPFFATYIEHVFHYMLPSLIGKLVLADRGVCLVDPNNAMAREAFRPTELVDAWGRRSNKAGKPYLDCDYEWTPPGQMRNPWDNGCFLYKGEGKAGSPGLCQKTGAKVKAWYFDRLLPEGKVAWESQVGLVYEEAVARLRKDFPGAEFRRAKFVYPESLAGAVEELLAAGCRTIVYQCYSNPVYSDFEEYAFALPALVKAVAGRAKVVCADQLGDRPEFRAAFTEMVRDQLAALPPAASVLVILSKHGHPFKKESQDAGGQVYREGLEEEVRGLLAVRRGRSELVWSCDEYADEYWSPKGGKLETRAAYRRAVDEGYDFALEFPTEFIAENTDLMIFHAMKKFCAFPGYDREAPVPYPDWSKPLTRRFHDGKTTGIYCGTPVGKYRAQVVEGLVASVSLSLRTS